MRTLFSLWRTMVLGIKSLLLHRAGIIKSLLLRRAVARGIYWDHDRA